jgi:hypothetical protein
LTRPKRPGSKENRLLKESLKELGGIPRIPLLSREKSRLIHFIAAGGCLLLMDSGLSPAITKNDMNQDAVQPDAPAGRPLRLHFDAGRPAWLLR